jgi:hypothetical protein
VSARSESLRKNRLLILCILVKLRKKARRTVAQEALKPITVEPVPKPNLLNADLPFYLPPYKLDYLNSRLIDKDVIKLTTFKKLISNNMVARIITTINNYAQR